MAFIYQMCQGSSDVSDTEEVQLFLQVVETNVNITHGETSDYMQHLTLDGGQTLWQDAFWLSRQQGSRGVHVHVKCLSKKLHMGLYHLQHVGCDLIQVLDTTDFHCQQ